VETINGCTLIPAFAEPGDTTFGPAEVGDAYVVRIGTVPPGPGPDVHVHPYTDEAFIVAEGALTLLLVDREVMLRAGGFVLIPRGTPHTAWNAGPGDMKGLILISPGDAEHVFAPLDLA
jgi:quercetin dioxygenase-like cupin family protein